VVTGDVAGFIVDALRRSNLAQPRLTQGSSVDWTVDDRDSNIGDPELSSTIGPSLAINGS
jgi:hypothetical protein